MSSSYDPAKQGSGIIFVSVIFLILGFTFGLTSAAGMIFAFMGIVGGFYGIKVLTSFVKDKSESRSSKNTDKMTGKHLNHKEFTVNSDEILVHKFRDGKLEKFTTAIDFRAFYMELHDVLVNNKSARVLDSLGTDAEKKKGKFFNHQHSFSEHFDAQKFRTRTGDMYEKKFIWNKKASGTIELELKWECQTPLKYLSGYTWCEMTIDVICRDIVDKEVLVGNQKKVLNEGAWEIRNRYNFYCNIVPEILNKIPIIRSSPYLKAAAVNYFYIKKIQLDMDELEYKIIPLAQGIILKHMSR